MFRFFHFRSPPHISESFPILEITSNQTNHPVEEKLCHQMFSECFRKGLPSDRGVKQKYAKTDYTKLDSTYILNNST